MFSSNNRTIIELVLMTLGLVFGLMLIFGVVHTGMFSLGSFFTDPKLVSQNESAYIDAIGSIAIGFAGAWVAIRIALVATNLQKEDSLKKTKEIHLNEAERVSTLNSELTRNVLEAKRSCTSFIAFLQSNPSMLLSAEKKETCNRIGHKSTQLTSDILDDFYKQLEGDLLQLIKSIEALIMDKTYTRIVQLSGIKKAHYDLDEYFSKSTSEQKAINRDYVEIILKDCDRFNFFEEYFERQSNFGEGLHFLRAKSLIDVRSAYLKDLVHAKKHENISTSEASWLLLGSLLLGSVAVGKDKLTYNSGFMFIALMLGSQIDNDLFNRYLIDQKIDKKLASEISETVFFIHGEDQNEKGEKIEAASMLKELAKLLGKTEGELHSLLLIPGENNGNSSTESNANQTEFNASSSKYSSGESISNQNRSDTNAAANQRDA